MSETPEQRIEQAIGVLSSGVNTAYGNTIANALRDEHPTLLGQIAKSVGVGIMRRTMYDSTWKAYTPKPVDVLWCHLPNGNTLPGTSVRMDEIPHPSHDGRLDCSTIIGAELLARQSLI